LSLCGEHARPLQAKSDKSRWRLPSVEATEWVGGSRPPMTSEAGPYRSHRQAGPIPIQAPAPGDASGEAEDNRPAGEEWRAGGAGECQC
jgi:hypothetical protein